MEEKIIEDDDSLLPVGKKYTWVYKNLVAQSRPPVIVEFSIYSLGSINSQEQNFYAYMKLMIKWYDPDVEKDPDMVSLRDTGKWANGDGPYKKDSKGKFPSWLRKIVDPSTVQFTKPRITFGNAIEINQIGEDVYMINPNDKPGYIKWEHEVAGTFAEYMELDDFPWDRQDLHIVLRMPFGRDNYRSFEAGKKTVIKPWIELAEFEVYQCTTKVTTKDRKSTFTITVPVTRKSAYYSTNIMWVMSCLVFLNFSVFAIPVTDLADRLSVGLTLLLTAIAFKLVIADDLPRLAYWTKLDYYMNFMFAILFLISVANAVVTSLPKWGATDEVLPAVDNVFFIIFAVICVIFNIAYLYVVKVLKGRREASLGGAIPIRPHTGKKMKKESKYSLLKP